MRKRSTLRKTIIAISCVLAAVILAGLCLWTRSISSRQLEKQLEKALEQVVKTKGERGLLELAGVPVEQLTYGDTGLSAYQGKDGTWTYGEDEIINMAIYNSCSKAVVYITTKQDDSVSGFLDISYSTGIGSGFFISSDGYILTNKHVVAGASNILVTTADGDDYNATLCGTDDENDLAVLKIQLSSGEVPFLEFGDSDSLAVGQKVLAIGNPFGYERTMTDGIVSGLSRPIRDAGGQVLLGMIQTSAQINSGNSGGPLLNMKGQVIGICTSILTTDGAGQGLNFAVASNTAALSASDIIRYGKVNRGWLDIVPVQLTQQIIEYAGLKVDGGILVSQVVPGGFAEDAGMKGGNTKVQYGNSVIFLGGDVIAKVNGCEVAEYADLFTALSATCPGDTVEVVVNRAGKEVPLKVRLVERTSENIGWINR